MSRVKLGILISGTGSNMAAIIAATKNRDYPAEVALVLSNRPKAKGIDIAQRAGIKTAVLDHRPFGDDREGFEREVDKLLQEAQIELLVLAGFMRMLSPWMVSRWNNRMINIHPSLLPKFKGLNTHARVLKAKEKQHGCTVHWVSEGVDEGKIIDQSIVKVEQNDTEATLASRVLLAEHQLYPSAIKAVCPIITDLRSH